MTPEQVKWPTFLVYGIAILGSLFGGSIPLYFINRGMPVYKARMNALLLLALLPLFVLLIHYVEDVDRFGNSAIYMVVSIICLAAAAHQGWSANLYTTVSDLFPKSTIASVIGIGTMSGGLGGVLFQILAGKLTDLYRQMPKTAYFILFVLCSFLYLTAWGLIKMLVPKQKMVG
jgi:ACS family hexuronate transporter-like MFS transporter